MPDRDDGRGASTRATRRSVSASGPCARWRRGGQAGPSTSGRSAASPLLRLPRRYDHSPRTRRGQPPGRPAVFAPRTAIDLSETSWTARRHAARRNLESGPSVLHVLPRLVQPTRRTMLTPYLDSIGVIRPRWDVAREPRPPAAAAALLPVGTSPPRATLAWRRGTHSRETARPAARLQEAFGLPRAHRRADRPARRPVAGMGDSTTPCSCC